MTSDERYNLMNTIFNNYPENIELIKNYKPDTVHEALLLYIALHGGINGGESLPVVSDSDRYTNEQIDALLYEKVDTMIGYGLSQRNFTPEYEELLQRIQGNPTYDPTGVQEHIANTDIHVTSDEKNIYKNKQNKLIVEEWDATELANVSRDTMAFGKIDYTLAMSLNIENGANNYFVMYFPPAVTGYPLQVISPCEDINNSLYFRKCIDNTWSDTIRLETTNNKVESIDAFSDHNHYTSAKAVYDFVNNLTKNKDLKTYTNVNNLGLNSITSVTEIFNAMPDNSMGIFECNGIIDGTPAQYGQLMISKSSINRFNLLFKCSSASTTLENLMYIGNLKGENGTGLSWNKILIDSNIVKSLNVSSTHDQLPSAKTVYNNLVSASRVMERDTDWHTLITGSYRIVKERVSTFTNSLFDTFTNEYPYGNLIVFKSGLIHTSIYYPCGEGLNGDTNKPYDTDILIQVSRDDGTYGTWFKFDGTSDNGLKACRTSVENIETTNIILEDTTKYSKESFKYNVTNGMCQIAFELNCVNSQTSYITLVSNLPKNTIVQPQYFSNGTDSILVKIDELGNFMIKGGTTGNNGYKGNITYVVKQ